MRLDHTVICQFQFICNERWENLTTIHNEPTIRFCSVCNSQVHLTDNYKELEKNFAAKRCVAIFIEGPETETFPYMGGPWPSSDDPSSYVEPKLDPIVNKPVDELELLSSTSELLKINRLQLVGDLITRTEVQLVEEFGITENQLNEILDMLADLGLTLGMKIEDWQIESAKYR